MTSRIALQKSLNNHFPKCLPNKTAVDRLMNLLTGHDLYADPAERLLVFSVCADESNRPLEHDFVQSMRDQLPGVPNNDLYFSLGGLAGFPFAGPTGFAAMASHIPIPGHAVWIYGPHVGVDNDGEVGFLRRRGTPAKCTTPCCGSAVAALDEVLSQHMDMVSRGASSMPEGAGEHDDDQQNQVIRMLSKHAQKLASLDELDEQMVELPFRLFQEIDEYCFRLAQKREHPIAMIGGIQINTNPDVETDFFLPLRFDLLTEDVNDEPISLLDKIYEPKGVNHENPLRRRP